MQPINQTLRNLVTNERGNVMMTFGLTSFIAIAAIGGAVDFGRTYSQKQRLQNALDAAVVSGMAKLKSNSTWQEANTHALGVFRAIYYNSLEKNSANPNPPAGLDQPVVQFQQVGTQIKGTVTMTASTPFLKFVIGQDINIGADSTVTPPSGKMLEVALMVDLTGSMGWNAAAGSTATDCDVVPSPSNKIDYLKCAGEDLLNILLPASGANDAAVKIGVAPFSDKVNAGSYAAAVTGLAAEGGAYANISNLAQTKQTTFTGTYSGAATTGSQFGAMGATATTGSTVTTSGATFNNSYCSSPTSTTTVAIRTYSGYRVGIELSRDHDTVSLTIPGVITMTGSSSGTAFKKISDIDGTGSSWSSWMDFQDGSDSYGYFVPLPENPSTLTKRTRTATSSGVSRTGNIGASVSYESDIGSTEQSRLESLGFIKASSSSGYWKITEIDSDGSHDYSWTTSGWYLPLFESLTATTTTAGCESAVVATPSSKLISCVTERKNGSDLDYTDDAPASGKYVGPFNHGVTSKSNYSSDGKCWTSGRELPAVIPLTNQRSTLASFFSNATVGGATAGHLGTAWAQYILSPDWSTIWPDRAAVSYSNTGVQKAAILMTDGEYNIQFFTGSTTTNTSAKQALMLCKQMRDNGIKVYTVGFGFADGATPPSSNIDAMSTTERTTPLTGGSYTAQQKALDTLAKCASNNSSYYFPYDGQALRNVFKNIASSLSADLNGGKARLTQ